LPPKLPTFDVPSLPFCRTLPNQPFAPTSANANAATINGFVSGTDSISLSDPAGGTYSLIGSGSPTQQQVAFTASGGNTTVNFGDGTTWTLMNVTLQNSDFH